MDEIRFELKGWMAVAAGLAFLAVMGYRTATRFQTVDDAGRGAVRERLIREYQGLGPKELAKRVEEYRAGLPVQIETPAAAIPNIELTTLSAHGLPHSMIAKVGVSVDGGPPPNGPSVRYFRLTRTGEGTWYVLAETNSYQYYEALMN
jgi:hypothetical protein